MTLSEHLQDEWEFHKRQPEMFILWAAILYSIYLAFTTP
jgi:hypothetical protein